MNINISRPENPLKASCSKKKVLLILSLLLFSPAAKAEVVLYCQDELATGFVLRETWTESNFKHARMTLKFDDAFTEVKWSDGERWDCEPHAVRDFVRCRAYNDIFLFNKKTLRYLTTNLSGMGWLRDVEGWTESIHAGTCTKF